MTDIKAKHKWDFTPKRKTLDSGVSKCKNCPCIREFVKGKVHYFINDTVYYKSPMCEKL